MPIYEYHCRKCENTFEVIQKISDPELEKHEECGGAVTRLISLPTVQFATPDPYGGNKHTSLLQQKENEAKARERKKKSAAIVSTGKQSR